MTNSSDDRQDLPPGVRELDQLGTRAGAALHQNAPPEGLTAAMTRGNQIRTRRLMVGSVAIGALAIGGIAVANRDDNTGEQQAAVAPSVPTSATPSEPAPTTSEATPTTTAFDRVRADDIATRALFQLGDTPAITGTVPEHFSMELDAVADAPECADYLGIFHDPKRDTGYAYAWYTNALPQSVMVFSTEADAIEMLDAVSSPGFVDCNLVWQQRASDLLDRGIPVTYSPASDETFDVSAADQAAQLWVNNSFENQAVLFLRVGRGVSILNPGGTASGWTNPEVQALIPAAVDRLRTALGT